MKIRWVGYILAIWSAEWFLLSWRIIRACDFKRKIARMARSSWNGRSVILSDLTSAQGQVTSRLRKVAKTGKRVDLVLVGVESFPSRGRDFKLPKQNLPCFAKTIIMCKQWSFFSRTCKISEKHYILWWVWGGRVDKFSSWLGSADEPAEVLMCSQANCIPNSLNRVCNSVEISQI